MKELVERLHREHAGALTALLTRVFGPTDLDRVESVVRAAFDDALDGWPSKGAPDDPLGWLVTRARRRSVDELRRLQRARANELPEAEPDPALEAVASAWEGPEAEAASGALLRGEIGEDVLRMMYVVCHPSLTLIEQMGMLLRELGGYEVEEVARVLSIETGDMTGRFLHARQTLRAARASFDLPGPEDLPARTEEIHRALHALFIEGTTARGPLEADRAALCLEAVRLAEMALAGPAPLGGSPPLHGLVALMLLQAARLPGRIDADGALIAMPAQDRSRWDRELVARGMQHLEAAGQGSEYQLEASIAACHALAASFDQTDWPRMVARYDELAALAPSPLVQLNRAVAIGLGGDVERAIAELALVDAEPRASDFGFARAATGDLEAGRRDLPGLLDAYQRGIQLAPTEVERRLFRRRLAELA